LRPRRLTPALASAAAAAATLAVAASASAAPTAVTTLNATVAPAATSTPSVGAVADTTAMSFEVDLAPSDPAGAAAFARSVSDPASASYRQYLTPAQWEARFSPTKQDVQQVRSFLTSAGLSVSGVSADRMAVSATGTAAQVEQAFATQLSYHSVSGRRVLLNTTALSVPTSIAPLVEGVDGITQTVASPTDTTGVPTAGATPDAPAPPGFRNARPCSAYYGQLSATSFPKLVGYGFDLPYAPCGYTPPQMRSAYDVPSSDTGSGVTVAITDAYAAPTIYADASRYAAQNDPSHPLLASQFSQKVPTHFNHSALCEGQNGWWGEETLDVESVHAMAPDADILYMGAKNCLNSLNDQVRKVVDHHLADVVTDSWADTGGDLLDSASYRAAFDDVLEMAAGTGVTVSFSAGDDGDNYDQIGQVSADYPSSSPYATAVGGTTLQVGSAGQRVAENGWATGVSTFCNHDLQAAGGCSKADLGTWSPVTYDYGSGGGTSVVYPQPYYQAGVVPTSLSERHSSTPMRVEPDVALDADPSTGLLIGETQTFPDGVLYDQYRLGGTSLASPLFAGVIADTDQAAGQAVGFVNPALYALSGNADAIDDITPPADPEAMVRSDYIDGTDGADGVKYSARTVNAEGLEEQFCTKQACTEHPSTLETSPGYDNITGVGSPGAGFISALAAR
jgi:subtilase family serine protease